VVWEAIATAFTWRRMTPLTVRQARKLGFEARTAPKRSTEDGAEGGADEG
jgi:hypothetical protein